jgi:3-hydroxyisobutyrate dehydrogenase-like beta-hydroxyacid dehydrogenase
VRIGFVGLGVMGLGMVPRLQAAGYKVTGWNRTKAKAQSLIDAGMGWADTPKAVAEMSDVVFTVVTDG